MHNSSFDLVRLVVLYDSIWFECQIGGAESRVECLLRHKEPGPEPYESAVSQTEGANTGDCRIKDGDRRIDELESTFPGE